MFIFHFDFPQPVEPLTEPYWCPPDGVGEYGWAGTVEEFLSMDKQSLLGQLRDFWKTRNDRYWKDDFETVPNGSTIASWRDSISVISDGLHFLRTLDDRYSSLGIVFEYCLPASLVKHVHNKTRLYCDMILVGETVEAIFEFKRYTMEEVRKNNYEYGIDAERALNCYREALQGHHDKSFGKSKETIFVCTSETEEQHIKLKEHSNRFVYVASPPKLWEAIAQCFDEHGGPIPPRISIQEWAKSDWTP